jgi:hypothetical protein
MHRRRVPGVTLSLSVKGLGAIATHFSRKKNLQIGLNLRFSFLALGASPVRFRA